MTSTAEDFGRSLQLTSASILPIPILKIWRVYADTKRRQQLAAWIEGSAFVSAALLLLLLVFRLDLNLSNLTIHSTAILLLAGATAILRKANTPRSVFMPSIALVIAAVGASLTTALAPFGTSHLVQFLAAHLVLVGAICSFILFARFRYADLFVRYALRILLAGIWTSTLALVIRTHGLASQSVSLFQLLIVANLLLLSFTLIDDWMANLANRWLFRTADYQKASRELGSRLDALTTETNIHDLLEKTARESLDLRESKLIPLQDLPKPWPAELSAGEIAEMDVDILVPLTRGGETSHALRITPGSSRPGLVLEDLNFLRRIAAQASHRLEQLYTQSREKQIIEAELTALRAQIHPHFLFNSLNAIVDLIVSDPPKAELMTLRLSSVFRHVLANSSKALTTVREEMDFIRTYLSIEEIRFSDRLTVSIDVPEETLNDAIPSLILQPLVENALKHGLARKPGPATLWIRIEAISTQLRIIVEDDGLGPGQESGGLGLKNVLQRLQTHFPGEVNLQLIERTGGGSSVTMTIPRHSGKSE